MKEINVRALIQLKGAYQERKLTRHQYRTLRGQVFAGDPDGAMRGLRKLLLKQQQRREKQKMNVSRATCNTEK